MPLHERKCWDCGNVAQHTDNVTPEVLCRKCGSQDTRATRVTNKPDRSKMDIPQNWVRNYVDQILVMAKQFEDASPMRAACVMRAEYAMDLVKAFRESE